MLAAAGGGVEGAGIANQKEETKDITKTVNRHAPSRRVRLDTL
jgi:hypothetical protein